MKEIIIKSVTDLNEEKTMRLVKKALKKGIHPKEIIAYLQKGMENVGKLFEEEEYFLGDLIMAGIIFKEVLKVEEISGVIPNDIENNKGTILIGTVENDIHDIGKDIFIGMALMDGFHIVDLGVNVSEGIFIEKVKEVKPKILGLSGLLSDATKSVIAIIEGLNKSGYREQVKIIVGGGMMNKRDEDNGIYADAYVKSSEKGIEYCNQWAKEWA